MKIDAKEVAEVLRQGAKGEIPVSVVGDDWITTYAGDVTYRFGDWEIVIFNDCGELDYIDSAKAPDGRTSEGGARTPQSTTAISLKS